MNKLEFSGNLKKISPDKIIDKNNHNDFESFFLILAMIFNDLKGLIFFQKIVQDNYRKPDANEISIQMGEYGGLLVQTNKLIIATVNEFLLFLKKNESITSNVKFLVLLKKLNNKTKVSWTKIINPNKDETSVISKIARIRSNISFHYDHSTEELRKGFIRSFFAEGKSLTQHKDACFSLGNDMQTTRFYYADAAAEEYIKSLLNEKDMRLVMNVISDMNQAIQSLLGVYINSINK